MPPLFVPLQRPVMAVERASSDARGEGGWTIERAEALLGTLTGVVSARVVAKPGGEILEIHLLTTEEVSPKQTVRNVESALMAHFDLEVDHRKISVARSAGDVPGVPATRPDPPADAAPAPGGPDTPESHAVLHALGPQTAGEPRILFLGHQIETERSHRIRMRVAVEWQGERYEGEAAGTDMPRTRLETVAEATLRAIEAAMTDDPEEPGDFTLALDGVKQLDAFERRYVLVAVHALTGREVTALAGAATVEDAPDRSVILATLQATDRWVRGRS